MTSSKTITQQTPRTSALLDQIQSQPLTFEIAFWRLLDLARSLEIENEALRQSQRAKEDEAI